MSSYSWTPPPIPITLTQEEVDDLLKVPYHGINTSITDSHRKGYTTYEYGYTGYKSYVKHEWKSILLLMSTVYNCSKCGAKKEEAKDAYCEEDQTW